MAKMSLSADQTKKLGDDVRAAEEPFVAMFAQKAAQEFRSRYPEMRHIALRNGGRATIDLAVTCDFNPTTRSVTIVHQPAVVVSEARHIKATVVLPE